MLKHIVMWKFKPYAEGKCRADNLAEARDRLLALASCIPEVRHLEAGVNAIPGEQAYDLALIVTVENPQALQAYLDHPRHQAVSASITKFRESRISVDMEM